MGDWAYRISGTIFAEEASCEVRVKKVVAQLLDDKSRPSRMASTQGGNYYGRPHRICHVT